MIQIFPFTPLLRLQLFKARLHAFRESRQDPDDLYSLEDIAPFVNESLSKSQHFDMDEITDSLFMMQDDNQIMFSDGSVVFI